MASHLPGRGVASRFGWRVTSRLSWRVTLVQFLANAIVIGLLILVLPGFRLHAKHELLAVLWLAAVFGVLSALVRPALEFLLIPYVLQSLGLIVVAVDAALLALLALTRVLEITGIGALLVGALLAGVVGFLLDGMLGLTPPVVDDASARAERSERALRIAAISERLRLMQVYGMLVQYTVDFAFDWAPFRPFRRRMQEWMWRPTVPIVPLPSQVKARLLLQDLGPTYVKLGQILSSQGRALPLAWEEELEKLQSEVRPFAYDDVRTIIAESLGAPPETLYESFNPTPLAAASLAQVHEATTHDGDRVAVKVQRPNIHEQLRSDVKILTRAATIFERRVEWAADADLTGAVREFGTTLLLELDYTIEAYNARRLERALARIEKVHVPAVEPTLSSDRVLTLEFIEGVKSTETGEMDAAGLDRQELARNLVRGAVQMVMIEGFFHADPHPGNVVVELASGRVTFLDTGMVGVLDLGKRISFARFLLAFRDKDVAGIATALRSLSSPFREPDESAYRRQFEQRIGPLIDPYAGQSIPMQRLVTEALDVLRSSGLRLDSQLILAAKTVAQAEAITSALVPEAEAGDFAKLGGAALEELVPQAVDKEVILKAARRQAIFAAGEVAQRLPSMQEAASAWLDQFQRGEISVRVHLADLDPHLVRFGSIPRLIAAAVLITGVLIGSALAAAIDTGESAFRAEVADVALVAYLVAAAIATVLVAALLWRLIRPERHRGPRRSK
ncbi:MAG TPA: AarF/UbiB family protein [Gaiellaceae bacterium]